MSSWGVEAALRPCPSLAATVITVHVAVAAVPWLAGCEGWIAGCLSALAFVGLVHALQAVPGRTCRVRVLRFYGGSWAVSSSGTSLGSARLLASSRVLPEAVFCRLLAGGQMLDVWIPRHALPPGDFRRLKVAVRCGCPGQDGVT